MTAPISISLKNKFGQYFTPEVVADFMMDMVSISNDFIKKAQVLEPSCGEGVFLDILKKRGFENVLSYEIDADLANSFENVQYESFVSAQFTQKFDLIIGNPPYIRWKNLEEELKEELAISPIWNKYFNSLCDYLYIFILKSIELLEENGQLIFICPEYWLSTTHSLSLRNYMVENGYFETIYHFNETPIFEKVTVSILIFKFIKSKNVTFKNKAKINIIKYHANRRLTADILQNLKSGRALEDVVYLKTNPFEANEPWLLADDITRKELAALEKNCEKKQQNDLFNLFNKDKKVFNTIGDICDIGNGLVSGLDKAFQWLLPLDILNKNEEKAILKVVKAKDLKAFYTENITNYIFIKEGLSEADFCENYPNFYHHFQTYKADLEKRYQYNKKINYWEWVFLRNFNLFSKQENKIFVPCKERISHKNHFRFAFSEPKNYPTQDVTAIFRKKDTKEDIKYILAYLNNYRIFEWLKYNGIVKGNIVEFSEKPIASIPFRKIDWQNDVEITLHDAIVEATELYLNTKNEIHLNQINDLFNQLLNQK
jgi:adenine-specific DNA-methyltransferase